MRSILTSFAIAAAAVTLALPASAKQTDNAGERTVLKAEGDRYCTNIAVTGSLLPMKVCHTRAEWVAEGARIVDTQR